MKGRLLTTGAISLVLAVALSRAPSHAQTYHRTGTSTAATATALAANGANCSAGSVAGGVDASGTAEACLDPVVSTEIDSVAEFVTIMPDVTGTGNLVRATSPTIVTPTIASFANATHDHTNAAGGGALAAYPTLAGTNPFTGTNTFPAGAGTETFGPCGLIEANVTPAATTAVTTEETLWTYTLPANTLSANGAGLQIIAHGGLAANGNSKTVRVYFGASVVTSFTLGTGGASGWRAVADVLRKDATNQIGSGQLAHNATFQVSAIQPTETLSGAIVIKVTGQNGSANANDITFRFVTVKYCPA